MNDAEKIKVLGSAIIILAHRLLRLEPTEKFRKYLRETIEDVGKDICELDKKYR